MISDISLQWKPGCLIASDLSLLLSYFGQKPEKYDFINLSSMKEWVSSRIKNITIGVAITWRKIIREDIYNNKIKFANNYFHEIKDLPIPNKKIKIWH